MVRLRWAAVVLVLVIAVAATWYLVLNSKAGIEAKDGLLIIRSGPLELAISENNGSIVYVKDSSSSSDLLSGNRGGQLWSAVLEDSSVIGSADATKMTYNWNRKTNSIELHYKGKLDVDVSIGIAEAAKVVMNASVRNDTSQTIKSFRFPYELNVEASNINDALLPMLPGAVLQSAFFTDQNSFEDQYPGVLFAPYISVQTKSGPFTLYDIHGEEIKPLMLGFKNQLDKKGFTGVIHDYHTWIKPQEQWETPNIALVIGDSYEQSIERFRNDNGIQNYRALADKLGDQLQSSLSAPFLKLDVAAIGRENWSTLQHKWIDTLRYPSVLHLVAFQKDGHDENYPDFLPPDPQWGTQTDMKAFIQHAHTKGHTVVPYTNFSWWGVNAPTLQKLPNNLTLHDIVVKKENGSIIKEDYGPHSGYVMRPGHPFVKERVAEEYEKLLDIGFDGIFEDQWGIRNTPYDFNEPTDGLNDPSNAYVEGMKRFFTNANHPVYIEDGFDILANTTTGFMGSTFLWDQLGYRPKTAGYVSYYPMISMLARDKVMLFQHNLATETSTMSKQMLRWNLAMGYSLSADLQNGTASDWIDTVSLFQAKVIANYGTARAKEFQRNDHSTITTFGDYTVIANWHAEKPLIIPDEGDKKTPTFTLAPDGVQVYSKDGLIRGGIYLTYNGLNLDNGDHYLIENRTPTAIQVYQPQGSDTTLAVAINKDWKHAIAKAYQYDGTLISELPVVEKDDYLYFDYISQILGKKTAYVEVTSSENPSSMGAMGAAPFVKKLPLVSIIPGKKAAKGTSRAAAAFDGGNTVDGDPYTYWESASRNFPQAITIDLEEAKAFNLIRLALPPIEAWESREQKITIEISQDGKSFIELLPESGYIFDPNQGNELEVSFDQVKSRYVKLIFTDNTAWPAAQLAELGIFLQQ